MPSCLVVGQGSIGRRHARILADLGVRVATVSRRGAEAAYRDLPEALSGAAPDYVVVATETADHGRVLDELAGCGFTGSVLVEKPLFHDGRSLPPHRFGAVAVAYQLRFHPALRRLRESLAGERILSARLHVGQYLPDWRPDRDHRRTYSGQAALGGGCLRDLSHELDYALWLFGPWRRLAAIGGVFGELGIDSDDLFCLLAEFENCPAATIQLDYLDRRMRREIVINTARHTYSLDLAAGILCRDREPPEIITVDRDAPYRAMHEAMLRSKLGGDRGEMCDEAAGMMVMEMIQAAGQAARDGSWVASSREDRLPGGGIR